MTIFLVLLIRIDITFNVTMWIFRIRVRYISWSIIWVKNNRVWHLCRLSDLSESSHPHSGGFTITWSQAVCHIRVLTGHKSSSSQFLLEDTFTRWKSAGINSLHTGWRLFDVFLASRPILYQTFGICSHWCALVCAHHTCHRYTSPEIFHCPCLRFLQ